MPLYDRIGARYSQFRRPDPRIGAFLIEALGDCEFVLNVGAGTGSYEPDDRAVIAVEPSRVMLNQRGADSAPAVQAAAEELPFPDGSFDAAMAILTLHHWSDQPAGLRELKRVSRRRVVLLTWVPPNEPFWLVKDYFPEIDRRDRTTFPNLKEMEHMLGPLQVRCVPIPHDCSDGFMGAYWRRPEAYLKLAVRSAISSLSQLPVSHPALQQLEEDLSSGAWHARHGHLLQLEKIDLGYRVIVAER